MAAMVGQPLQAIPADPAVVVGLGNYPIPDAHMLDCTADGRDNAGQLMSKNSSGSNMKAGRRHLQNVNIRAADTAGIHLD